MGPISLVFHLCSSQDFYLWCNVVFWRLQSFHWSTFPDKQLLLLSMTWARVAAVIVKILQMKLYLRLCTITCKNKFLRAVFGIVFSNWYANWRFLTISVSFRNARFSLILLELSDRIKREDDFYRWQQILQAYFSVLVVFGC